MMPLETLTLENHGSTLLKAAKFIASFEGFRAEAYLCPAGVWTIGFGETSGVKPGMVTTKDEAMAELLKSVAKFERAVHRLISVPLTDEQTIALTSFCFNMGAGALQRSTMRQKINRGEHGSVPAELMKWVWAGKTKLPGLIRRRAAEAELYAGQTIEEA